MPTKRLFIAVDISDEARGRAVEHIGKMREAAKGVRVSWERAEKLHLTVHFLGNVDDQLIGPISEAVGDIARGFLPFEISVTGTGVFPRSKQPRVLWLGVEDSGGALAEIASQLDKRLSRLGFEKQERPFSPHLTIGRIREPQKAKGLAVEHLQSRFEQVSFTLRELVLYESELTAAGAVYRVLAAYPFAIPKALT